MKAGIHPDYHEITVVMTDGTKFKTRSTWGKEGDTLTLDVDPLTHPAWTGGGAQINKKASRVAKFAERFGSLGTGAAPAAKKDAAPAEAKKDEKKK